jgi:cyclophilin family peptidyl-prolyl cis-trans isomerase
VEIELLNADCPLAVANFLSLCSGDKGKSKSSGCRLHYKGIKFHRCVKDFVIQGGDVTHEVRAYKFAERFRFQYSRKTLCKKCLWA